MNKHPTIAMSAPAKESSNIAEVGYHPETKTLAVKFKGTGKVYHYADVSAEKHAALMKAESIGKHLNAHIKPYHKATPI